MVKKNALAVLLVLLLSSPALCGYRSASDLLSDCENESTEERCILYVSGVVDAMSIVFKSGVLKPSYCLTVGTPVEKLPPVVVKHLEEHPEKLDFEAPSVINAALRKAYPCAE